MGSVYTLFGEVGIGKIGNLFQQYLLGRFFRAVGSAVCVANAFYEAAQRGSTNENGFC